MMKLGKLLIVAAVTAGSSLFAVGNASAVGQLCTWSDRQYSGDRECTNGGYLTFNDNRVSSIRNDSSYNLCAYDYNGASARLAINSGHRYSNLALDSYPGGGSWNDRVSYIGSC